MRDRRRQLVIVGAGGHGRELLDLVEAVAAAGDETYRFLGFLDDGQDDGRDGGRVDTDLLARRGADLLGGTELLDRLGADYLIGSPAARVRARIDRYATARGLRPATLVHPRADIGGDVRLGPGTVVCALASLTTNIATGRHVVVGVGASVAHDCRLGDYSTVAPGARIGGGVHLGPRSWVGAQASVVPARRIGAGAVIGSGSVVTHDVSPELVVAGVPARPIDPAAGTVDAPRPPSVPWPAPHPDISRGSTAGRPEGRPGGGWTDGRRGGPPAQRNRPPEL